METIRILPEGRRRCEILHPGRQPALAHLARLPGIVLTGQGDHLFGKLPGGYVGNGDALEHLAQVGAQRDPYLLEGLSGAA